MWIATNSKEKLEMKKEDLSEKLNNSKEKLQLHMERFNLLREEGKPQEALEELKTALNFAAQTLQYSNSLLNQIHLNIANMPQEAKQSALRKIEAKTNGSRVSKRSLKNALLNIHIPDKKVIH